MNALDLPKQRQNVIQSCLDISAVVDFVENYINPQVYSGIFVCLQEACSFFQEARVGAQVVEGASFGLGQEILRVLKGGQAQKLPSKCSLISLVIIKTGKFFRSVIDLGIVNVRQFGPPELKEEEVRELGDKILQVYSKYLSKGY
ncbi:MAG: hypothetical protein UT66_C0026G0003 [candidate division CPR2 bacterium GW2011_GWC1_39_9]|uniref:Uncharacterized protein n=1 Tax=candidate division CPR2 bacterium GW2011_GWC2_39_10 TaxID=1618345 RepID=A0A0G0M3T6_UNCC2|nr:MAG: hypothetical protein UT18_C0005G0035 [candidate division CPR2 bacterium GW2011_GWC2_39_10]KKR34251.1 MAG: hypothetical protein UT66_C0026G0003 [candidate division CPR2 bacterium GW2011_GWC1_39_9]